MKLPKAILAVFAVSVVLVLTSAWALAESPMTAPPGGDYKKVSSLVKLPDFIPGLGSLYVVPSTLPAGPFLAYDHDGKLVSSIYMVPLKDMEAHKAFEDLGVAGGRVAAGRRRTMRDGLTRRQWLEVGGLVLAGLAAPRTVSAAPPLVIRMRSDAQGAEVWFDPIGVFVEPGRTVRWVVEANVHTTTAYHPRNDRHSLRIPEAARPWDSGFLVNPGDHFDVTLTVPGVYDYYCTPHEAAGMVGRIVVGRPSGPGTLAFDYFMGRPGAAGWKRVPLAAQRAFPSVEAILRDHVVERAGHKASRDLGGSRH